MREGKCTPTCPSYLSYRGDVTDPKWAVLELLTTPTARRGRRRLHPLRRILTAIFYLVFSAQRRGDLTNETVQG